MISTYDSFSPGAPWNLVLDSIGAWWDLLPKPQRQTLPKSALSDPSNNWIAPMLFQSPQNPIPEYLHIADRNGVIAKLDQLSPYLISYACSHL